MFIIVTYYYKYLKNYIRFMFDNISNIYYS